MNIARIAIIAFLVALAGCDREQEPAEAESADETLASAEAVAGEPEKAEPGDGDGEGRDPCAVLTEELVRETFQVPDDAQLEQNRVERTHPNCSYSWAKPNAEELRAEFQKKQQERIQQMAKNMGKKGGVQGLIDGIADMPSLDNEVGLTLVGFEYDDEEAAAKAFDRNMETLNKGITQKVKTGAGDDEVTFQMRTEPVEGVGDQAAWSARMDQLSVRQGDTLFHVRTALHGETEKNLEAAKKLTKEVIDRL